MSASQSKYVAAVDVLKGILILTVIIGHLFTDRFDQNPWKWAIYAFHMPLFMGLGGYLIGRSRIPTDQKSGLLRSYFCRIFVPWIVAFTFFTAISNADNDVTLGAIIRLITHPTYHLWYVPVFLIYAAISFLAARKYPGIFLVLSIILGVVSVFLFGVGSYSGFYQGDFVVDERLLTMAPFFFLGLWISNRDMNISPSTILLTALVSGSAFQACFWLESSVFQAVPYFILNFSLILSVPVIFKLKIDEGFTKAIGYDSLYFYLWHPLPIMIGKATIYHVISPLIGGAITLLATLIVLFIGRVLLAGWSSFRLVTGLRPPLAP